ncbi:MAG: hypothetical protein AYK19_18455 [Theionarchaea archaeon DG-70-1]|nr:MAG: hypothetical protein AYK19_18455 [Theionarchaea archaeon DG-70-1]
MRHEKGFHVDPRHEPSALWSNSQGSAIPCIGWAQCEDMNPGFSLTSFLIYSSLYSSYLTLYTVSDPDHKRSAPNTITSHYEPRRRTKQMCKTNFHTNFPRAIPAFKNVFNTKFILKNIYDSFFTSKKSIFSLFYHSTNILVILHPSSSTSPHVSDSDLIVSVSGYYRMYKE